MIERRGRVEPDLAIARYYTSLTAADRQEDDDWAALGDDTVSGSWDR